MIIGCDYDGLYHGLTLTHSYWLETKLLLSVLTIKQLTLTLMALLTMSLPVERPCTKALAAIKARDN